MKAALIRHDKVTDELGNTVEIKLWKIPLTPDVPQGYEYSETFAKRPLLTKLGGRLKFQSSKYLIYSCG